MWDIILVYQQPMGAVYNNAFKIERPVFFKSLYEFLLGAAICFLHFTSCTPLLFDLQHALPH